MLDNPVGLNGMEFIEYVGPDASLFKKLFQKLGMEIVARHKTKNITLYRQNEINFLLNEEPGSFAEKFQNSMVHPSVPRVFGSLMPGKLSIKLFKEGPEPLRMNLLNPCPGPVFTELVIL